MPDNYLQDILSANETGTSYRSNSIDTPETPNSSNFFGLSKSNFSF